MDSLSHHAYLIPEARNERAVEGFLAAYGIALTPEVELLHRTFATMGIDDARAIAAAQLRKTSASAVIFLIETSFMTREAQNALLKTLEEPSSKARFIIATSHPALLLPTLRSRLMTLHARMDSVAQAAPAFAPLSFAARSAAIAPMIESADRALAAHFMKNIINELHQTPLSGNVYTCRNIGQLNQLYGYITDSSSSVKLILEYAAYSVPFPSGS